MAETSVVVDHKRLSAFIVDALPDSRSAVAPLRGRSTHIASANANRIEVFIIL